METEISAALWAYAAGIKQTLYLPYTKVVITSEKLDKLIGNNI